MRAERTRYEVAGWGVGELWTADDVVLAHDFRFDASRVDPMRAVFLVNAASSVSTASPMGGGDPPFCTVATYCAQVGDDFVTTFHEGVDAADVVERLAAFLAGEPVVLDDVRLDLAGGTPFQRSVATALRAIPRGDVVTYGELAAIAGYSGAQRAVGTFCARNRFMFLLPCHRVVGSAGIGGYGSAGVGVKRRLLALEGVSL
ncbi:hypothetical protein BH09ACT13_BH09ACT13_15660 [soil metagenome]